MGNARSLCGLLIAFAPCSAFADLVWKKTQLEALLPPPNQTREIIFQATNSGQETLHIESIKSTCSCTDTQLSKRTVAPGEMVTLCARIRTVGSPQERTVRIEIRTTEAPARRQVLQIRLLASTPPPIEPTVLWWNQGSACTPRTISIPMTPGRTPSVPSAPPDSAFEWTFLPYSFGEATEPHQLQIQPRRTDAPAEATLPISWTPPFPGDLDPSLIFLKILPPPTRRPLSR